MTDTYKGNAHLDGAPPQHDPTTAAKPTPSVSRLAPTSSAPPSPEEVAQMREQLWTNAHVRQFDDILREHYDQSLADFADTIIYHLAKLTGALRGALFLKEDDQHVRAKGGYACTVDTLPKNSFAPGEGLIGQAVRTNEAIYLPDLPAKNVQVAASLGNLTACCLMIQPLSVGKEATGVVELVYLQPPPDRYRELLAQLARNIAAMLGNVRSNLQT